MNWGGRAAIAAVPTTDLVDLGGIPYRHTGAKTAEARGGVRLRAQREELGSQFPNYQVVSFDRPEEVSAFLRGGRVFESMTAGAAR